MKRAVMYGAGNIGRGFIGKIFSESGYEVCFVDVIKKVVDKLNEDGRYHVKIISNEGHNDVIIENVRAVDGMNIERVAAEIAQADIMATAVGVNVLPKIIKPICAGLKRRFDENNLPLNVIICENLYDADKYLGRLIEEEMGDEYKQVLKKKLGLVGASIGRMVPVMTDSMRQGDILRVWVEPYEELPVDKAAFVGEIPVLKNLIPYTPFGYYKKRKLFVHNMGHVMCAYLGWQKGYKHIYECVQDKQIYTAAKAAMTETAFALCDEYCMEIDEMMMHVNDLLFRFGNEALGDTVERVGRDPLRKLRSNDRLIGAAKYCLSRNAKAKHVITGIVAALRYDNQEDEAAVQMQEQISQNALVEFLAVHCEINVDSILSNEIVSTYMSAANQSS